MREDNMSITPFGNVQPGQRVFGLIFGNGVVRNVWDGHYKFEVEYENGQVVPYCENGVPGWRVFKNRNLEDLQTVFYAKDIDILSLDMSPTEKIPSIKKIIKWKSNGKLEIKCPSGIWRNVSECPEEISEEYISEAKFHLFRKAI